MPESTYVTEAIALVLVVALVAARALLRSRGEGRTIHRRPAGEFPAIEVRERRGGRELWFECERRRMLQARVDRENTLVSRLPYIDGLHLYSSPEAARALFVGCGSGIGARQFLRLHPRALVDLVDVDGRIFDVATTFFDLEASERCALHVGDGRDFLEKQTLVRFDRIVVDVFGANDMPPRLCTEEFFRLCRERLSERGVCVVNTAGTLEGSSSGLIRAIHAGLCAAFGASSVIAHAVPRGKERVISTRRRRNVLLFAFRSAVPQPIHSSWGDRDLGVVPAMPRVAAATVTFSPLREPLRDASVGEANLEIQ